MMKVRDVRFVNCSKGVRAVAATAACCMLYDAGLSSAPQKLRTPRSCAIAQYAICTDGLICVSNNYLIAIQIGALECSSLGEPLRLALHQKLVVSQPVVPQVVPVPLLQ